MSTAILHDGDPTADPHGFRRSLGKLAESWDRSLFQASP